MCLALYLGAERELPTVSSEETGGLFVVDPIGHEDEPMINGVVASPFIYYAGSFEGCGCGFEYENRGEVFAEPDSPPLEDPQLRAEVALGSKKMKEDWEKSFQSVGLLRTYLEDVVKGGPVTLWVTWDGTRETPEDRRTVTPAFFGGESFHLELFTLYSVVAS